MTWFDPLLRPELAQITAYRPAHAPPDAVRLDANESPYALEPDARRVLGEALAAVDLHRYPDVRATRLRERIAERAGAHPDEIVLGSGSDEAIALVLTALSAPRGGVASALFPEPSFVMFRVSALIQGLTPRAVPLDDHWDLDVPAFERAIAERAPNVVFLPSPNNPTGKLFARDRIDAVVRACAGRSLVLLDEAYGAFAGVSYADLRRAHDHVGQLQTLSKIGLAAARVGWAVLPADLAAQVDKARQPYNLNALSQRAAELCLGELWPALERAVARVRADREVLRAALGALPGVRVEPSDANFLWVDVGRDAGEVYRGLAARGVIVRSFHTAGGRLAQRLRITVGTPAENARLLEALRAVG